MAIVSARSSGCVAGQHEDVVLGVEVVERGRERDAHRVAGAPLHALLDELDRHLGDELLLQRLGDALGAVADDDDDALERQLARARRRRAAPSAGRTAGAAPSACRSACACPRRRRARRRRAVGTDSCVLHRLAGLQTCRGRWLGGEGSNLDLGLQRTLCCRYTTPDSVRRTRRDGDRCGATARPGRARVGA